MYWICFGDSAKGMLTFARSSLAEAVDMGHMIALSDDLSIGDISDLNDREKRSFGICPWKNDPEFAGEAEKAVERYYAEEVPRFNQVDKAVIWYGDSPAEQCGMLRAAHDLYARGVPFSLVHVDRLRGEELPPPKLLKDSCSAASIGIITENKVLNFVLRHVPQAVLQRFFHWNRQREYRQRRATLVEYRGVGELDPEAAPIFYRKRRRVKTCEAKLLYTRWEKLVQENAPLRVMKDGKLVSAPADYYDETILSNVPKKETVAAMVVGKTLAQIRVNDCQIFERMRELAKMGRLEIVKDGGNYRETVVKRL